MKRLFMIAALCGLMAACGGNDNRKSGGEGSETARSAAAVAETETYGLDDLLAEADKLIGKKVTVRGYVTHTCTHSGKRCFIVGESQKTSMRVEAKGNIGGFNRELIGSQLAITGTMHENRLSQEYLAQMEKEINEKNVKEPESGEACAAELANIEEMRAWMKENGKDYYALYYMDGEDYEVVEE